MFGKLIKHEWKQTYKNMLLLDILIVFMTIVGYIALRFNILDSENVFVGFTFVSGFLLYYVSIFLTVFGTFILIAVRFYRSMYCDEGYLTHTLPVNKSQLILSKWLVGFIWGLIATVLIFLSLVLLLLGLAGSADTDVIGMVKDAIRLYHTLSVTMQNQIIVLVVLVIINLIISIISTIGETFTAISFGQMIHKNKLLASIGCYFVIGVILQIISSVLVIPVVFANMESLNNDAFPFRYMLSIFLITTIMGVVLSVSYYFISTAIAKKKLNLD